LTAIHADIVSPNDTASRSDFSWHNDERMHHYQRRRTSITGLMVELRGIIATAKYKGTGQLSVPHMKKGHLCNPLS